jgi:flagellar basal body P-ring protein FlgI
LEEISRKNINEGVQPILHFHDSYIVGTSTSLRHQTKQNQIKAYKLFLNQILISFQALGNRVKDLISILQHLRQKDKELPRLFFRLYIVLGYPVVVRPRKGRLPKISMLE